MAGVFASDDGVHCFALAELGADVNDSEYDGRSSERPDDGHNDGAADGSDKIAEGTDNFCVHAVTLLYGFVEAPLGMATWSRKPQPVYLLRFPL